MPIQCLDDPTTMLSKEWCLSNLSKDLVSGTLHLTDSKSHQCQTPSCKTFKTVQQLKSKVVAHAPCDSHSGNLLEGLITVERLITVFDQDASHRGIHAGDFVWQAAPGIQVTGRMSGMTNVGTHRLPVFADCQKCDAKGVMEGRLCGQITTSTAAELRGCQIMADYRLKFEGTSTGAQANVTGTLEGVIICSCGQ